MKTIKIILIASLVAVALVNSAKDGGFKANPVKKVLNISITEAEKMPELVAEMYKQLDPEFLLNNQLVYTKYVLLRNTCYRISGTWEQWRLFFNHMIDVEKAKPKLANGEL